jgi:hypothetical protein
MVEPVDLLGVGKDAGVLIADHGTVLPAVPQPRDDVHELIGSLVALGVERHRVTAEVLGDLIRARGDDVPGDPAATDVVDRRELAGQVVGLLVGARRGADESDLLGAGGQGRDQRERLEQPDRPVTRIAEQSWNVREEDRVERSALSDLGETQVVVEAGRTEWVGLGQAP